MVHPRNISNRGMPVSLIDDGRITKGWVGLEIAGACKLRLEVIEITYGNIAQFHILGFVLRSVELPYSMTLAIQIMGSVQVFPVLFVRV